MKAEIKVAKSCNGRKQKHQMSLLKRKKMQPSQAAVKKTEIYFEIQEGWWFLFPLWICKRLDTNILVLLFQACTCNTIKHNINNAIGLHGRQCCSGNLYYPLSWSASERKRKRRIFLIGFHECKCSVSQMASAWFLLTTSDESPSLKGASHQAYSINNFRLCEFFNGPQWRKWNQRTS